MVGGAEHQADALVAERDKMAPGLFHGNGVVAGDAGEAEMIDGRIDQDDRDPAVGEHLVGSCGASALWQSPPAKTTPDTCC